MAADRPQITIDAVLWLKGRGRFPMDFEHALSDHYRSVDAPFHYFLQDPIIRLIKWDLIQAFDEARIVEAEEIEQDRIPLRILKFYLSPLAATMEDA